MGEALMLRASFITAFSCVFLIVLLVSPVLGYSEDEAKAVIEMAEGKVLSCYKAVSEAEKAGANVGGLLDVLNEAGWFLSKAKLAYNQGDFDSAVVYANSCNSSLDGFVDQAESLRVNAEQAGYWDFMVNFVGSGVGALCVVVGGFVVWSFLKKYEKAEVKA